MGLTDEGASDAPGRVRRSGHVMKSEAGQEVEERRHGNAGRRGERPAGRRHDFHVQKTDRKQKVNTNISFQINKEKNTAAVKCDTC